jgi:hypothetical protein
MYCSWEPVVALHKQLALVCNPRQPFVYTNFLFCCATPYAVCLDMPVLVPVCGTPHAWLHE